MTKSRHFAALSGERCAAKRTIFGPGLCTLGGHQGAQEEHAAYARHLM